jgi:hypothetical protein
MSPLRLGLMLYLLSGLCCLAAFVPTCSFADDAVVIAVNEDILPDYLRFLQGRDPKDVHLYSGPGARRDVIELVLLMQAVRLGGFTAPIELRSEQSYLRTLRDIAEGRFITSAGLAWKVDIDAMPQAYLTSRPLIKQGEFVVGLYTTHQKQKTLSNLTPSAITALNIVTNSQWKSDVQTLKDLGFEHITYSPNWVNIARMSDVGRADITLAPFQTTANMVITVGDLSLYPLIGVKVAISGSRHWPISRKHPQGDAFYQALERGITQLENNGIIQQAYRECGFFHPDVVQWKLLNSTLSTPHTSPRER